jgi:hypothetical protein
VCTIQHSYNAAKPARVLHLLVIYNYTVISGVTVEVVLESADPSGEALENNDSEYQNPEAEYADDSALVL